MKKEGKVFSKWMYWFTLVFSLIIVYKILDSFTSIESWFSNLLTLLTPFIVGIIIAYILYIPCRNLENFYNRFKYTKKRARGLSVFTVYVIAVAVIVIAFRFIIPIAIDSFQDLIGNLQNYYRDIRNTIMALPEDSIWKSENVINVVNGLSDFHLEEYINLDKITEYAQSVINFASGLFKVFVSVVVSVYILLERKEIVNFFRKLIRSTCSEKTYKSIGKYFRHGNEIFGRFLSSQFMDAIVVAILASVAMSIMKVKYAVLLGIFIGLFNLIPYFGAIIAVVVSIIITILTGGLSKAIEMGIVVIILQQIDANIINPKIVGDSLKMSPLLVIFSVTIGGAYFGVIGMFLAVPIAAVLKLVVCDYIDYNYKKKGLSDSNEEIVESSQDDKLTKEE